MKNGNGYNGCAYCWRPIQFVCAWGGLCGFHFFEFAPDILKEWRKEHRLRHTETKGHKGASIK